MLSKLRIFIPAALICVLGAGIVTVLSADYFDRQTKIRAASKNQLKTVGNLISANIETAIRYNHNTIVRAAIEQAQATRLINYSLLIDQEGVIISANKRKLEGQLLISLPEKPLALYTNKLSRTYTLEYLDENSDFLVYQLPLTQPSKSINPVPRADKLILIANISEQLKLAKLHTFRFAFLWAIISSISAVMIWWILQKRVVKPVDSLRKLANFIAEHRENLPPPIPLMEEFQSLDASMRSMAMKLWHMEQSYQDLYDKNPATFISVNTDLKIININVYGSEVTGHTKQELLGKPITLLYFRDDQNQVQDYLEHIFKGSSASTHWEARRITKAGKVYWTRDGVRRVEQNGEHQLLIVSQDITDLHRASQKLTYQATHDGLTGLLNRSEFSRLLGQAIKKSQTQRVEHCVCLLDLDQFKIVNDLCGHAAGDELLKQIAQLFLQHIHKENVIARLGGDEFGLLLEYCEAAKAMQIIDTLREALSRNRFNWGDKFFEVGISAGVTIISEATLSKQTVMSEADSACYAAKSMGRNRSILFQAEGKEAHTMMGEMQWVNKVTQAIEDNSFVLYFQHILPLEKSANDGFKGEVLLRILENDKLIPPGAFLPAAERYNIAYKIDHWVVKSTLNTLNRHKQYFPNNWQVSINLSAQTISRSKFNYPIIQLLEKHSDLCKHICFEITETSAMASYTKALDFINRARSHGVQFALDDFGSGFSSFGYLKKMHVDYVKIDGMFVRHLSSHPVDVALVDSMNNIAHALQYLTIAEFIDNQACFEKLKALGVDYGQGYHLHEPEPLEAVLLRLQKPKLSLAPSA